MKRLCLETMQATSIFVDDDPTHYVDIGVTKDQKYLIISSNTKEDSEIWVLPREGGDEAQPGQDAFSPAKIVHREKDVRVHIDHLRDFFVTITTDENKNYKLAKLPDSKIQDGIPLSEWEDLLAGFSNQDLVITELDVFKDFFAIYCKRNGRPEILIQDLDTNEFHSIDVDEEVGEILPGLNQDYDSK